MTTDRDVMTLAEAAEMLGVCKSTAYEMAAAGDFPGVVQLRSSGKRRRWVVSVPRFLQAVHGLSGLSEPGGHTGALSVSPTPQGQPAPTSPVPAPLLRWDWGRSNGKEAPPCVDTEPTEVSR